MENKKPQVEMMDGYTMAVIPDFDMDFGWMPTTDLLTLAFAGVALNGMDRDDMVNLIHELASRLEEYYERDMK